MDEKLSIYDIAEILAQSTGKETADVEKFVEALIALVNEGITKDGFVRIKGIGSFKVILVKERESVHINTGERIVIPAHHKLSFLPDKLLKEKINRPFAFFEAVETNGTESNETASASLSNDDEEDENDEIITAEEPVQEPVGEATETTEKTEPKAEEETTPLTVLPPEDEKKEEQNIMNKEIDKNSDQTWSEERAIGSHPASAANRETLQSTTSIKQEAMNENKERKEQPAKETPKSHPAKPPVKKKKQEASNTSLYVILALLLLLLGVGIFYYFYYDRLSYNEFNGTTQHTQTTDDSFLLPGDSTTMQESEEGANVDTLGVTTLETNENTATSPVTPAARKEPTASPASTSPKQTTSQQTKSTKPAGTAVAASSDKNVMARVKIASGERLTLLAQKYYGNKIFWVYIYDFNKARIPDPDRVPAGMEILIPAKEVYAINAQSSVSLAQAKELQSKIMAKKAK